MTLFRVMLLSSAAVGLLAAVAVGFYRMERYEHTPGAAAAVLLTQWPDAAAALPRAPGIPTLVMSIHPQCPCTRASLGELEKLAVAHEGRLQILCLFSLNPGEQPDTTSAWRQVAAIKNAVPIADHADLAGRVFGARTSGQTYFFSAAGALVYEGGLTAGRGHEGDNVGSSVIHQHLAGKAAAVHAAPVFGCALQ